MQIAKKKKNEKKEKRNINQRHCFYFFLPECIEYAAIVPDPQHAIGCGDPVGISLFGVAEEGVRDPDLSHHVAVETQHLHGAVEL